MLTRILVFFVLLNLNSYAGEVIKPTKHYASFPLRIVGLNGKQPVSLGSGILIRTDSTYYAITARHVIVDSLGPASFQPLAMSWLLESISASNSDSTKLAFAVDLKTLVDSGNAFTWDEWDFTGFRLFVGEPKRTVPGVGVISIPKSGEFTFIDGAKSINCGQWSDSIIAIGYPGDPQYSAVGTMGVVLTLGKVISHDSTSATFNCDAASVRGMSGGPVLAFGDDFPGEALLGVITKGTLVTKKSLNRQTGKVEESETWIGLTAVCISKVIDLLQQWERQSQ